MTDEVRQEDREAELIRRLENGERNNELDVQIEVALFKPSADETALRANAAGTKVISTDANGKETTHWAADWGRSSGYALAKLRATLNGEKKHG